MHQVNADNAKVNRNKDFIRDPLSGKNFHPGVTIAVDEVFGKLILGVVIGQARKRFMENISLKNIQFYILNIFIKICLIGRWIIITTSKNIL